MANAWLIVKASIPLLNINTNYHEPVWNIINGSLWSTIHHYWPLFSEHNKSVLSSFSWLLWCVRLCSDCESPFQIYICPTHMWWHPKNHILANTKIIYPVHIKKHTTLRTKLDIGNIVHEKPYVSDPGALGRLPQSQPGTLFVNHQVWTTTTALEVEHTAVAVDSSGTWVHVCHSRAVKLLVRHRREPSFRSRQQFRARSSHRLAQTVILSDQTSARCVQKMRGINEHLWVPVCDVFIYIYIQ